MGLGWRCQDCVLCSYSGRRYVCLHDVSRSVGLRPDVRADDMLLLPSPLQVVDRLVSRADVQLTAAAAAGEGSPGAGGDTSRGPGGVLMVLGKRYHVVNSALMLLKVGAGHCRQCVG